MIISNDPSWWSTIGGDYIYSYFIVACSTMVIYDWALTFGKEVDLIWRQPWSFMTLLYLSVRYMGVPYYISYLVGNLPSVSLTDQGCTVVTGQILLWASFVLNIIFWVIMVIRAHAINQRSRKISIFLVVTLLVITIACAILIAIRSHNISGEELLLSGTYFCAITGDDPLLVAIPLILGTAWEVLALCLTAWIAVTYFRELPRNRSTSVIVDCISALVKSHMFYFAEVAVVACFSLISVLSPTLSDSLFFLGIVLVAKCMQLFVLGPRLILSIRDYHARPVVHSDAETAMTSIAFEARDSKHVHVSTGGDAF